MRRKSTFYFKLYGVFGFIAYLIFLRQKNTSIIDDWGMISVLISLVILILYFVIASYYENKKKDSEEDIEDCIRLTRLGVYTQALMVMVTIGCVLYYRQKTELLQIYYSYVDFIGEVLVLLFTQVFLLVLSVIGLYVLRKKAMGGKFFRIILFPVIMASFIAVSIIIPTKTQKITSFSETSYKQIEGEKNLSNGDIEGCIALSGEYFCYEKYAILTKDASWCQKLDNGYSKNNCILNLVKTTKEVNQCSHITDTDFLERCKMIK